MKVVAKTGHDDIAIAYIADMSNGKRVEFVESVQPPFPRETKWVLIVSTLYGCPVGCRFCDAGNHYEGVLSRDELLSQIDYMVKKRYPDGHIPVDKFKVQFARMGEPSMNPNVLDVLEDLPKRYDAPGLMPCISTVAPEGTDGFFERLLDIKNRWYGDRFQLQFSVHTTDQQMRSWLVPVTKWDFRKIADYGEGFFRGEDRKITLNFALAQDTPVDPDILLHYFSPDIFFIKITPINPTYQAHTNGMTSYIMPNQEEYETVENIKNAGYDVLVSIGQWEENQIGSNCGQYATEFVSDGVRLKESYQCEDYLLEIE